MTKPHLKLCSQGWAVFPTRADAYSWLGLHPFITGSTPKEAWENWEKFQRAIEQNNRYRNVYQVDRNSNAIKNMGWNR